MHDACIKLMKDHIWYTKQSTLRRQVQSRMPLLSVDSQVGVSVGRQVAMEVPLAVQVADAARCLHPMHA